MGNSNSNLNSNIDNIRKTHKFYDFDIDTLLKKERWSLDGNYLINYEKINYTTIFTPVQYNEKIINVPFYAALDLRDDYKSNEDYLNRKTNKL